MGGGRPADDVSAALRAACLGENMGGGRPEDFVSAALGAACLGQNVLFVFGGPEGVVSAGAEDGLAKITDWEVMIDCNGCCGCPPAFAHRGVISEWPKFINISIVGSAYDDS